MAIPAALDHPDTVEAHRAALEQDLSSAAAAKRLRESVMAAPDGALPRSALATLAEVCALLDGEEAGPAAAVPVRSPRLIERSTHEALVIHPREKRQRQHKLASWFGRVLNLVEGDEAAQAIRRVTKKATADAWPQLCRLNAECAETLQLAAPDLHIARGDQPLFAPLVHRSPFLCVHEDFLSEGAATSERAAPPALAPAEMRFALGHQLEHIKSGHAALLQISPERLEFLFIDLVIPSIVGKPLKLATRAIGWSGAHALVKKVRGMLPGKGRAENVVENVDVLLPAAAQETVLPGAVHEWVRSWIPGVEFSADRAGLLVSGSVRASCTALLRLSPAYAPHLPGVLSRGLRGLLQENAAADYATSERLRELLRFALSPEYLAFVAG